MSSITGTTGTTAQPPHTPTHTTTTTKYAEAQEETSPQPTKNYSSYVLVVNNFLPTSQDLSDAKNGYNLLYSLPIHVAAVHYCYSNPTLRLRILGYQAIYYLCGHNFRIKFHYGTPKELEFILQTYGIYTHYICFHPPTSLSVHDKKDEAHHQQQQHTSLSFCSCTSKYHLQWLERILQRNPPHDTQNVDKDDGNTVITPSTIATTTMIVPGKFDVLFGKSKQCRQHTGNLRCQVLIEMNMSRYEQATKVQKSLIADEIIAIVHESKGRFLKQHKDKWVEVSQSVAKDKVAHFFRNRRLRSTTTTSTTTTTTTSSPTSDTTTPAAEDTKEK
jgi:hypothetical protein